VYEGNFLTTDYTDEQMLLVMSSEVETSLQLPIDATRETNDEFQMTKE